MPADGEQIVKRYNRLKADRGNFDSRWEAMAPYLAPSREGITSTSSPGAKQGRNIYDSTTLAACELMAMFFAGKIINPAQRWMGFQMRDRRMRNDDAIREWLEECRDRQFTAYTRSAWYAEAPESLVDAGGFGTGFLLQEERPPSPHQFAPGFRGLYVCAEKTGRFVIAEGADSLVDTAMREYKLTARAARDQWGDERLPEKMKTALATDKLDEQFPFIHAIQPRPKAEQKAGNLGMPWLSAWVEKESKTVVHESGYRRFPAAVPRWQKTPGEVYGRGRGDLAFPDTWTLNMAKGMGLEDWALKIRPPTLARSDSVIGSLRLTPAGLTTLNTHGQPLRDVIMPYESGSRPEVSQLKEEELRRSIRQIFFVDVILDLLKVEKSEMTAYEFGQKLGLLYEALATVYGRLEWEWLLQSVEITFDLLLEAGEFSPPPPEVYETDGQIDVIFDNPMARAQRAGDAQGLAMAMNDLAGVGQVFPQVWDWLDPDKIGPGVFEIRGVPAIWTRSQQEVTDLRAARQQQNQTDLMAERMAKLSETAKNVAPMMKALQPAGKAA